MREKHTPRVDENFAEWEEDLFNQANGRDHWAVDRKNILSAIWPLFLYIGIVSLLLLYLWSR